MAGETGRVRLQRDRCGSVDQSLGPAYTCEKGEDSAVWPGSLSCSVVSLVAAEPLSQCPVCRGPVCHGNEHTERR